MFSIYFKNIFNKNLEVLAKSMLAVRALCTFLIKHVKHNLFLMSQILFFNTLCAKLDFAHDLIKKHALN